MNLRELKALEIAARTKLAFENGAWSVPSQSGKGTYRVVLQKEGSICTCEDWIVRQKDCKHILAARFVSARDGGTPAPPIDTDSLPAKKTYKQNWRLYNEAQITEKRRFRVLLADLCRGLENPSQKRGRPRTPITDAVFASVYKVYSTVSSRRFGTDLAEAHEKGFLTKPIHPNMINKFLKNPGLAPILQYLILRSSLPLRIVEQDFAVDSTGFSTSRHVKWHDEKYGESRSKRDWVKAHSMCGVKTNVVTAVKILDRDTNDCPQFKHLVEETAKFFAISEVSADKAYLSSNNLELVEKLGGTAYIPFKSNSLPGEVGSLWWKKYHQHQYHREEFLGHYHKRSNVESTFSMIKAKFGDSVRSLTSPAMENEVLCKILCHNICVVIQSQLELGIEAVFEKKPARKSRPHAIQPQIQI